MIKITLPDGSVREYAPGTTSLDIAKSISEGLARKVLAATVNGIVSDLSMPIQIDSSLKLLTWDDTEAKSTFWHSSAHLMAEALEFHFPGVKLAIGPPVTNGFYYDIDFMEYSITEKDLEKVEAKMKELAKSKNQFIRQEISKAEAIAYFEEKQDPYKLELLSELEDGTITFYTQGNFTDLCRGPHIPDTGFIKAVKLTSIAGAYWRGDEKNKQLTRIYGITFPKNSELTEYLGKVEEAKRRDHRKLGKELELFTFSQKV
jgi:threonyl-tRNA synthetase